MNEREFDVTPHERIAAAAIAKQFACALREAADAADYVARLAENGSGDCMYANEVPYLDGLVLTAGALWGAFAELLIGPGNGLPTQRHIEGRKPLRASPPETSEGPAR